MKKEGKRPAGHVKRITAAFLAAAVVLGAPVWSAVRAEAENTTQTKDIPSLTVKIQGEDGIEPEARQGLSVTVDLYKIADATPMEGYDAYNWTVASGYEDLEEDLKNALDRNKNSGRDYSFENGNTTNADYRALANEAAKITLGITGSVEAGKPLTFVEGGTLPVPIELNIGNGFEGAPLSGLEKGIYLLVPHGTDLTKADQYTVSVNDGEIATVAYTENRVYRYLYLPELVSVPATNPQDNGWDYNVVAALKSEVKEEYVSLEIIKNVTVPEGEERLTGEDHFVYQIEAVYKGKKVYSNVVELTLPEGAVSVSTESLPNDSRGKKPLHNIVPAGAEITVTEVYAGASYELAGEGEVWISSAAPDKKGNGSDETASQDVTIIPGNSVEFTNSYTGADRNGGAVENRFVYNGKWDWENDNQTGN